MRLWVATLRIRVALPPSFSAGGARVVAFWHGQQMALLAARRLVRGAVVLVSHSKDGDVQAGVMTALGFRVVRGSSSRGGAVALAALVGALRAGGKVALAVDGPRGPRHVAKGGAAAAAHAAEAPLFPAACASRSAFVLSRTWDGFELPLPFSRVAIIVGAPLALSPTASRTDPHRLGKALAVSRRRAERLAGIVANDHEGGRLAANGAVGMQR
ncbi:MAG TPA: DUF374 domain-containing protein [Polyangiaceae bacterium]|nr:DUF374 domain-containing protein [Polyangiaceae bacterium]